MVRVLLLVLVVVAVLAWWASARRRDARAEASRRAGDAAQPMLACAHCGVHVPRSEAVLDAADRAFCSDAHRLQGER